MTSYRIWTVSNALSVARMILVIPVIYYLREGQNEPVYNLAALGILLLATITDLFDGFLARKLNQITEFGKIIDPFADKVITAVVMAYLAVTRIDFPAWLFVMALVRDILIFSGGVYVKAKFNYLFTSNLLGKWTFAAMAVTFTVFIVKDLYGWADFFTILKWLTAVLLVVSFVVYTLRLLKFVQNQRKEPS